MFKDLFKKQDNHSLFHSQVGLHDSLLVHISRVLAYESLSLVEVDAY